MRIRCDVVHKTPGRVRLRVRSSLKVGDLDYPIRRALQSEAGVQDVRVNGDCRSVIIRFNPRQINVEQLIQFLEAASFDPLPPPGSSCASPRARTWLTGKIATIRAAYANQRVAVRGAGTAWVPIRCPSWHATSPADVARHWGSCSKRGLADGLAEQRLSSFGTNRLEAEKPRSQLSVLLNQLNSLPVALLLGSAAVSVTTAGLADAVVILSVVAINAAIGFVTESQAEQKISTLLGERQPPATVIRNGQQRLIVAEQVVPGDLLVLSPGESVAADGRLIEVEGLTIDESPLTGESMPVPKSVEALTELIPLSARHNMVYRGTVATGGNAKAIVVATGPATEIGGIQRLIGTAQPPETPVQRQLRELGALLAMATGGICTGVFGVGLARSVAFVEMLSSASSLAVAAVPEGLPMVATTTLALGVNRLRAFNVLVRRLDAVETLGSVQVLCLDKTGTLTMNQMQVVAMFIGNQRFDVREEWSFRRARNSESPPIGKFVDDVSADSGRGACCRPDVSGPKPMSVGGLSLTSQDAGGASTQPEWEPFQWLMKVIVLCNEAETGERPPRESIPRLWGSPTETALIRVALAAGMDVEAVRAAYPRLRTQYRSDSRRYMCTRHRTPDAGRLAAVKGQPDEVLGLCEWQLQHGARARMTPERRARILEENERMAGEALRVLGVAYRLEDEQCGSEDDQFVWLGLVGIADPVRPGVADLIQRFHRAGIRTIMVTGDQSATAYAIGRTLNLSGDQRLDMVDSAQLEQVDAEVLKSLAQNVHVFSAVSPSHKLQIVQALQRAGMVVAMTGDGINDGPALRAADIGVAMGGDERAELARMTADLVLLDDNLETMIVAIRQGRSIYENIRKSTKYLLATNLSEIAVMVAALAAGTGPPLNPMQLLWINLVSDIFPVLALALQPPDPDVLARPPRDPNEPLLQASDLSRMSLQALTIGAGTLGSYVYGVRHYGPGPHASTMAFMSITGAQLLHMLSAQSESHSVFSADRPATNRLLYYASCGGIAVQLATVLLPGLRRLLRNTPLQPRDWLVSVLGAVLPFVLNELLKGHPGKRHRPVENHDQATAARTAVIPVPGDLCATCLPQGDRP